jgi:hypothetical protein
MTNPRLLTATWLMPGHDSLALGRAITVVPVRAHAVTGVAD